MTSWRTDTPMPGPVGHALSHFLLFSADGSTSVNPPIAPVRCKNISRVHFTPENVPNWPGCRYNPAV